METVLPCPVQNRSLKLAQGCSLFAGGSLSLQGWWAAVVMLCGNSCDLIHCVLEWIENSVSSLVICEAISAAGVKLGALCSVGGGGWMQVSLYSLWAKLWTQAEVCFPEEHSHSSGAFAQGLTARIYLSNYLLHDLCSALHLSALKSFTSPTFCPQEQSINTNTLSQHSDWIWGLTCTWGLQGGKVHLRVASGFWIDGSRCELFTLYSCVEGYSCSWRVWVIEMPRGLFTAWHSWS